MIYTVGDIIIIFIESVLLLTAAVSSSIAINNDIHQSSNPLVSSSVSYLLTTNWLLWISFILMLIFLVLSMFTKFIIIYYIIPTIGFLVLLATIFSGISTSQLRTIDRSQTEDSHITSAYSASLITLVCCLFFLVILIIIMTRFSLYQEEKRSLDTETVTSVSCQESR